MSQEKNLHTNQFNPYFASVNFQPGKDTEGQRLEVTRKFVLLPRSTRRAFFDEQLEEEIRKTAKIFNVVDINKVGELSRIVRDIFFGEASREKIEKRAREVVGVEEEKIGDFYKEIKELVDSAKKRAKDSLVEEVERLPIIPALKKYEKLGGQEITETSIEIEVPDEGRDFVEPTIRNWLEDYIQNKGAQAHNNLERSDYLYKSKNVQSLPSAECDKLSFLLRSYDLDEDVVVDKESQEIIFENLGHSKNKEGQAVEKGVGEQASQKGGTGVGILLSDKQQPKPVVQKVKMEDVGKKEGQKSTAQKEILSKNDAASGNQIQAVRFEEGISNNQSQKKRPHEITWYGKSSTFDNLEKIDVEKKVFEKQGSQDQLESKKALFEQEKSSSKLDLSGKNETQKTKHVVDLKKQN